MSEATPEPVHDLALPPAFVDGECTFCPPSRPANTGVSDADSDDAISTAPCSIYGQPIPMRLGDYKAMLAPGAPVIHAIHTAEETIVAAA